MTRKPSPFLSRLLVLMTALFCTLLLPAQKKSLHGKYSFITKSSDFPTGYYICEYKGKQVCDIKFEDKSFNCYEFNFFAIVKKYGKWGVVDPQGKTLIPFIYDEISEFRSGDGFQVWGSAQAKALNETKGYFTVRNAASGLMGVIDQAGNELVPCKYGSLQPWISKGVAYAYNGGMSPFTNDRWGMVDLKGNVIVPFEYRLAGASSPPLLLQDAKGKYGSFDAEGKVCLPFVYDAYDFNDASILKKNGKWGMILVCTAEMLSFDYDSIIPIQGADLYAVLKQGKWKVLNIDGDVPVQVGPDHDAVVGNNNGDGMNYVVKDGSQWQMLDAKGKMLKLLDCSEVKACPGDPYYLFSKNGKSGLYTEQGEIYVPADYDSIALMDLQISEGLLRVYHNGKCGVYNTHTKKEELACLFDNVDMDSYIEAYYMHSLLIPVTVNGAKKVYINDPRLHSFGSAINIDNYIFANQSETSIKEWLWYVYSKAQGEAPNLNDLPDTNKLNPLCRVAFRYSGKDEEEYETMKIAPSFLHGTAYVRIPKGKRKQVEAILDYPVTGISYEQASDFCKWATAKLEEERYNESVNTILRLPEIPEWERIARKGLRPVDVPGDLLDSVNEKGCMLFRYKADKGCPFYDNMIKLRGNETVKVWDFNPDDDGLYGVFGNVAEMTASQGSAKGGSYIHYAKNSKAGDTIDYSGPESWLGFRYIIEFKQQ